MAELIPAINSILEASLISVKWKKYRDTVYRLFLVDESNDSKFRDRMCLLQKIIKAYMLRHSVELVEAVTMLADKEEDYRLAVQFLAAGYELADEKDHTI